MTGKKDKRISSLIIYVAALYFGTSLFYGLISTRLAFSLGANSVVLIGAIVLGVVLFLTVPKQLKEYELWYMHKQKCRRIIALTLVGLVTLLAINTCIGSISALFHMNGKFDMYLINEDEETSLWLQLLGNGIAAVYVEELIFRGVLFAAARTKFNFIIAAIMSSVLFGLGHGINLMGVTTFIVGIVLCLIYERTKNLMIPILVHSANNILAIITQYLLFKKKLLSNIDVTSTSILVISLFVSLALIIISIMLLCKISNNEQDKTMNSSVEL